MRRPHTRVRPAVLSVLALAALALTTGCAPEPAPQPTAPATSTPTPTQTGPVLVPDGAAEENLPLFESVVRAVWATDQKVAGRAYVDALVEAGFDKSAMELTPDRTTVDNPVDSLQFSVKWGEECLVGQVGPSVPQPAATVLPLLPTETCLLGETRPIDW